MKRSKTSFQALWIPIRIISYVWASPWTLLGLLFGLVPGLGQRTIRFHQGTVGIYGPGVAKFLRRCPIVGGAWAMTLGHTILACDEHSWRMTFDHEYVHVRQYEWFGPFFIPAYFLESIWQWCRGKSAYYDNRFEVQARKYS